MQGSHIGARLKDLFGQSFQAFRVRDFRWYFLGMVATSTARRMEEIAGDWLVYSLTGSALALGWIKTGWAVAIVASALLGGAVADRVRKRTVLVVGHALLGLIPLVLTILIATGQIQWWYIAIASLLASLIFSFDMPARQAYLSTILQAGVLMNAMALNLFAMAIPGVVFAVLSGALVDAVGVGRVYALVTLVYGLSVYFFVQLSAVGQVSGEHPPLHDELLNGFRYVVHHRTVTTVLGVGIVRTLLLTPCMSFLPVFAADEFGTGALGLGLLAASWAVGRLLGALLMAALGDYPHKGKLLLGTGAAAGVFVVLFARSTSFYLGLSFLCLASIALASYSVVEITVLQAVTVEEMRGRVSSYMRLTWGLLPLALLPAGFLIDRLGAPLVISVSGLLAMLFFLACWALWPRLRSL
jgi:MFS family permease